MRTLGPGFAPENIQADVDGDVSARLLAFVAPDAVSDAPGKAHVRARLRGTLQKPEVRGRLDLGTIDFRLRDMGKEVQVQSGIVEISNEGAILHNVRVVLDDQGVLVIGASGVRAGRVEFTSLVPFQPGEFDLPLHGERLTYRSPESFEVDDLAFDLDMTRQPRRRLRAGRRGPAGVGPLPAGLQDPGPGDQPARQRVVGAPVLRGQAAAGGSGAGPQRAHRRRRLRRRRTTWRPRSTSTSCCTWAARCPSRSWPATCGRWTAASTSRSCAATSTWCPTSTTSRSSPPSRSPTARRPSCTSRRKPGHRRERQRPQRPHAHQRPHARGADRSVQRRRPGPQPGGDAAAHRAHRLRLAARVDAEPDGRRQRRHRRPTSPARSRATRSPT